MSYIRLVVHQCCPALLRACLQAVEFDDLAATLLPDFLSECCVS